MGLAQLTKEPATRRAGEAPRGAFALTATLASRRPVRQLESAESHGITLSARTTMLAGTIKPSALATLRFTISLNLVGA